MTDSDWFLVRSDIDDRLYWVQAPNVKAGRPHAVAVIWQETGKSMLPLYVGRVLGSSELIHRGVLDDAKRAVEQLLISELLATAP